MRNPVWMGVDIGTGGTRALLIDARGKEIAGFTAPHESIRMDFPQWAEQRPEDWSQAAVLAIRGALAASVGAEVRGIGLSGQMHGLVILDRQGAVIRPALIWCDQRSQPQVDRINQVVGKEKVVEYTANPVLTGFTLPKLLWVRQHDPASFERVHKVLLPKDYIRFCLTGESATDVSDASGTALLDVRRRRWSGEMMDALALDRALLPELYESDQITGRISSRAAELTGLLEGTAVIAGAGDQAAGAVGNGIVEPGVVSCTLGTSGVVFAHTETPAYDPEGRVHTFCHAVRGKWHVMGVTQGAGLSLQWLRNQLAPGASYDALIQEAETAPAGSQGVFWLPYLMGERTPHLDADARGGWIGLTAKHTRADLIRAVIEGVCYSQKDCLDIIEQLGVDVAFVRASGGGARSLFWRQVLADVLQKRVATLKTQEGSAYGAAILAMVGTGEYGSVSETCAAILGEGDSVTPRLTESEGYRKGHEVYRDLYSALRPVFARMTR